MTETTQAAPYIQHEPGDLITAEDWNDLQRKIHDDIRDTSQEAADGVVHVAKADDADHLEGKDVDALTDEVTRRVLDEVRGRTGYQQLFKVLKEGEVSVIEHQLGTPPLVDVYKLEYFPVVCREDDETRRAFASFYLHHTSERRVRVRPETGPAVSVDIQPKDFPDGEARDFPEWGIPFADMLTRYDVPYTETTSVGDLETEFWKAFFRDPNDQFGDDQYCHSPWFERCCKEQQSVRELKEKGDWNDIMFHTRPWKSTNYAGERKDDRVPVHMAPAPMNVGVAHLDLNRTAVWLLGEAVHAGPYREQLDDFYPEFNNELKVMVLLKA
jgi:hypothetical protein